MTRLLPLFALALATACNPSDPWVEDGVYGYEGEGTVQARIQSSGMPHVGDFTDDSRNGWYYDYDGWMDVGMDAYGQYGWAMLLVSGSAEDGGYVDVIGCTGKDDGYAEFDEPAVESEVEKTPRTTEEGEEVFDLTIHAVFADGSEAFATGTIIPGEPVYY
ncbi:MAG: hypothetical protein EP330_22580 [Deltaproteobacteria bacterium]|nr:MAG: hypothetical protein EP330_22580 [Deltaproteobacteria bacterium]